MLDCHIQYSLRRTNQKWNMSFVLVEKVLTIPLVSIIPLCVSYVFFYEHELFLKNPNKYHAEAKLYAEAKFSFYRVRCKSGFVLQKKLNKASSNPLRQSTTCQSFGEKLRRDYLCNATSPASHIFYFRLNWYIYIE